MDVTSQHPGWYCAFRIRDWALDQQYPLLGHDARLLSLRLDNTYIAGLLESRVSLPLLRHLRIDLVPDSVYNTMIWPMAWGVMPHPDDGGGESDSAYCLPCPVLEMLIIAALDAPLKIKSEEVIQLGGALGQLDREDGARARLVIQGMTFVGIGLDDMFASVQSLPLQHA
ncbi:hypothetical protein AURDEDRAFT_113471 [Auricularia subglabra TFB-10046 SS5]|nr:hypothetical protein AURDEDRAFT_113471 [Auricularia subglabra TFB-10046 SS5]